MRQEVRQKAAEPEWSFRELLRTKELRTPLYVVCALAMCQQLSGINVVRVLSRFVNNQYQYASHIKLIQIFELKKNKQICLLFRQVTQIFRHMQLVYDF